MIESRIEELRKKRKAGRARNHTVENLGNTPIHNLIVELKSGEVEKFQEEG